VLEAVRQNGDALKYAAEHLRDDGSFLYELSELSDTTRQSVRELASPRIQIEMSRDPCYLVRYAAAQVKPARYK
jgi:hypothetical protein